MLLAVFVKITKNMSSKKEDVLRKEMEENKEFLKVHIF